MTLIANTLTVAELGFIRKVLTLTKVKGYDNEQLLANSIAKVTMMQSRIIQLDEAAMVEARKREAVATKIAANDLNRYTYPVPARSGGDSIQRRKREPKRLIPDFVAGSTEFELNNKTPDEMLAALGL